MHEFMVAKMLRREKMVCEKLGLLGEAESINRSGLDEWQKYRLLTL